jgi:hypothetical protein
MNGRILPWILVRAIREQTRKKAEAMRGEPLATRASPGCGTRGMASRWASGCICCRILIWHFSNQTLFYFVYSAVIILLCYAS